MADHVCDPPVGSLLPGEVADSELRDDAEHWIAVYGELTRFLVEAESGVIDATLTDTLGRYRRRLDHWRRRRDELAADELGDES